MAVPDLPPAITGAVHLERPDVTAEPTPPERGDGVPVVLKRTAGWVWRLLILAAGAYGLVWLFDKLYLIVLPLFGATFLAALLRPLVQFFRDRGFPRALATWATVLIGFVVLGGVMFFVVEKVSAESGALANSLTALTRHIRNIAIRDLRVSPRSINGLEGKITNYLKTHSTSLAQGVLSGVLVLAKVLTGLILGFFICFFLLYDGDRIWSWLVGLFPARQRSRIHEAGEEAWGRISGWVRGTFLIAVFHSVVVLVTLTLLHAPLAVPLALLVFFGSFIPIVGSVVFGGLAALVTLVDRGMVPALILVGVLVIDSQIEAHLLQPFLVGRYVRLHPLAVVLVIAGGGFLEGIEGAIIALPVVSALVAATQSLHDTAVRPQIKVPSGKPP